MDLNSMTFSCRYFLKFATFAHLFKAKELFNPLAPSNFLIKPRRGPKLNGDPLVQAHFFNRLN